MPDSLRDRKERIALAKQRNADRFAMTDKQAALGFNPQLANDVNISAEAAAAQEFPSRSTPTDIAQYLQRYEELRDEMTDVVAKQVVQEPEHFARRYQQRPTEEMKQVAEADQAPEDLAAQPSFGAPAPLPEAAPVGTTFSKLREEPVTEKPIEPQEPIAGGDVPPPTGNEPPGQRVRFVDFEGVKIRPGATDAPGGMVVYNGTQMPVEEAYQLFLQEEAQAGRLQEPLLPREAMGASPVKFGKTKIRKGVVGR